MTDEKMTATGTADAGGVGEEPPPSGTPQPAHFLLILLNEEKYFVALPLVTKIINPLAIFPLPDTLDFIAGVANFSGEIVPMVDLKKALKLPDLGGAAEKKFMICMYRNMKVGFIIDGVIDAREMDTGLIKTDTTRVLENDFISGEVIDGRDVTGLVDIAGFIDSHKADG